MGPTPTPIILVGLGAVLVLSGIIGGGLSLKEIKLPIINNFSRGLACTFGIIFIIAGIYLERIPDEKIIKVPGFPIIEEEDKLKQKKKELEQEKAVLVKVKANIDVLVGKWAGKVYVKTVSDNKPFWEGDVIVSIKDSCGVGLDCGTLDLPTIPCSANLSLKSIDGDIFRFQRNNLSGKRCSIDVEEIMQPLADGTVSYFVTGKGREGSAILTKTTLSHEPPANADPYLISLYSVQNKEVKNVPIGRFCNIRITCGFDTQAKAQQGLSEIFFSVELNGESLEKQGGPGIISGGNGWHVYQDYRTKIFHEKADYEVIGTTYNKPNNYVDSREFTLRVN